AIAATLRFSVLIQLFCFCFFNEPATTKIYTLSLHDALPISGSEVVAVAVPPGPAAEAFAALARHTLAGAAVAVAPGPLAVVRERSEEHTSELQSRGHLVCRLLLEKKN